MQRPRNRSPPMETSFGVNTDDGFLERDLPPKEGEQQKSDMIDVEVRYLPFTRESPSGSIPKGPAGRSPSAADLRMMMRTKTTMGVEQKDRSLGAAWEVRICVAWEAATVKSVNNCAISMLCAMMAVPMIL